MNTRSMPIAVAARPSFVRRHIVWLLAAVLLLVLPHLLDSRLALAVMNQMMIMVLFTVAYNMLLGQGGMLSFGHAVYFGLGGYFAAHFINWLVEAGVPIPLPLTPLVGGVAGLLFALAIGSFSTNRAGTVFAMISLGIGELVAASSLIFVKFSGGEEGVSLDRTDPQPFFGWRFGPEIQVYHLIAVWMLLSVYLMWRFSRTPVGRMANAVRDNPERAEFVGYSQKRVRLISFTISGFFAGIAGALYAINYEIVTETTVNAIASGVVLLQAYIGGVGFFIGPIIGAVVFTLLQTLLSNYTAIWALYVGLAFVATVMYAPAGLAGLIMMHQPLWKTGQLGAIAKPYALMVLPVLACAVGLIGLLECFHFVQSRSIGESDVWLFWVDWEVDGFAPWLVFGGLLVGGFLVARRLAPGVAEAYSQAMARAWSGSAK